jgi:hypothetical protein
MGRLMKETSGFGGLRETANKPERTAAGMRKLHEQGGAALNVREVPVQMLVKLQAIVTISVVLFGSS